MPRRRRARAAGFASSTSRRGFRVGPSAVILVQTSMKNAGAIILVLRRRSQGASAAAAALRLHLRLNSTCASFARVGKLAGPANLMNQPGDFPKILFVNESPP